MKCLGYTFKVSINLFAEFIILSCLLRNACAAEMTNCDRRPFDTNTDSLPPDDRFELEIESITEQYIPRRQYNVRLYSKDNKTAFIGFSIWLREDEEGNEKNPRKPRRLHPGTLHPSPISLGGKSHLFCNNTVIQTDITPKTSVEALWIAPGKGNECVTLYAIVAIKPDVWYASDGPLSKRVCEDKRDADDILPTLNNNCQVCEDARYQLTFSGMWSYNTHPTMFPMEQNLARFSEVVGASHSIAFSMYKYNSEASAGMQMLAEQGNTTVLELEIQEQLGRSVRTVIKATAPAKTNLTTVTSFRTSREHHLVSLATGIMPSPDWFLGVANLELCTETIDKKSKWAQTVSLNMYPFDAGTDSGKTFESSNDKTSPPQPISSAAIVKDLPQEKKKAFARVRFDLIRTYPKNCSAENFMPENEEEEEEEEEKQEEDEDEEVQEADETAEKTPEPETTPKSLEPVIVDTGLGTCPMTAWEEWPCDGPCEEGTRTGYRIKYRYHMVDGIIVGKYSSNSNKDRSLDDVPVHCWKQPTSEIEDCSEECTEEDVEGETEETDENEEESE